MNQPVRPEHASLQTSDGLRLHVQWWAPGGTSGAVIAVVHGAAEHIGRHQDLAVALNREGYTVVGFDLRGHGRSDGRRLFVRSFDEYLNDTDLFLKHVRDRTGDRPLFLFAHSMGGAIATLFVLTRPSDLDGLILSGPLLKIGDKFSPMTIRIAKSLGRFLPRLPLDRIDPTDLSRDERVVRAYESDPLVHHGWIPAGTAAGGIRAIQHIERYEARLQLPILLLHGTADRLADVEGSKRLHDRASSPDKTLKLYEGFFHEVLNEPGGDTALKAVLSWLGRRTDGDTSSP